MREHDDQMRAIFRSIADEVQLPPGSDSRLLRAARRRRKFTGAIAALSLVVVIGGIAGASTLWSPTGPGSPTEIGRRGESVSAHYDQTSGECVGDPGVALDECNEELGRVRSALKNAATAQESFATTSPDGSYTDRFSDLAQEGFERPDDIPMKIFGPSVKENLFYCMEAYSDRLNATVHYSSMVGSPEPGQCFPELESVLKNAATSEESYATASNGRYTEDIEELRSEGLVLPDDIELTVTVSRRRYCIEALSVEIDATLHFSSASGMPEPGPC